MQQYTFTIPENLQAKELLNFILRTNIFNVESFNEVQKDDERKEKQKSLIENDLKESFTEIAEMRNGKKEKKSLKQFINEF